MKTQSLALLLASLASTATAWNPSERNCGDTPLCLKSFHWCGGSGGGSCFLPDGAYSASANPRAIVYVLLLPDKDYTISWAVDESNRETPVRVRWQSDGDIRWETNTTESQVTFNPGKIIQSLPSSEGASWEAMRSVSNVIDISQPELAGREEYSDLPGRAPFDMSDQFIVGNDWAERFLTVQEEIGHRDEYNKWKLGVGIGVGIGVPILMALTAVGTWLIVKRGISERRGSDPKAI